jgi:hypothetical protein
MFWEFRRDDWVVSLDWDVWIGFMVTAGSAEAEPLVRVIAAWLDSRQGRVEVVRPNPPLHPTAADKGHWSFTAHCRRGG